MLGWFADAAQPDAGLLAFRQVSEALGDTSWYLKLLRDDTRVAQRMARLLASSRYATGLLLRAPDAVAMLADEAQLSPRPAVALHQEAMAAVRRHDTADEAVAAPPAPPRRGPPPPPAPGPLRPSRGRGSRATPNTSATR